MTRTGTFLMMGTPGRGIFGIVRAACIKPPAGCLGRRGRGIVTAVEGISGNMIVLPCGMRCKDGLWIAATLLLVPIIGIFGGYVVGACLLVCIVGAITLPVWLPLYLLGRWLLWQSPRYRAGVCSRFWLREKISAWRSERSAADAARKT